MSTAILPDLTHFTLDDAKFVYEPADDTFLLCDAILDDIENVLIDPPRLVVEIGSGSGCVITFAAMELGRHSQCSIARFMAFDVNPNACEVTSRTAKANSVNVEVINKRFQDDLGEDVMGRIDVLIFNPPYVPTDDLPDNEGQLEMDGNGISVSWAGGKDGREVTDIFLERLPSLLSNKGICYLVLVKENKPADVSRILLEKGFSSKIIRRRKAFNEELMIMKIFRENI